jgi:hypothetical protein
MRTGRRIPFGASLKERAGGAVPLYREAHGKPDGGLREPDMVELPESVPKVQFGVAVALVLVGFVAILFAGGSVIILLVAMLLVLAGGGLGFKLGYDLWKATE